MHTITLELLRHGPAHNQLLSPLTPYLVLCENHGAVTMHVPFEHNQLLHRLEALRYRVSEKERIFQINDTATLLGDLLGMVPGLTAETNKKNSDPDPLTHIRLIISASELALLPFELALSPAGLPGAGQHLLLQPQVPICLTREVRRDPDDSLKWPERAPRILFVAAAPPEVGEIPLKAHLQALRRAIAPWVKYYNPKDGRARAKTLSEHFVFLPNATLKAIEDECASSSFTHVHILAHGVPFENDQNKRFALALHDDQDPQKTDLVSGARLATALRAASRRSSSNTLSHPTIVTMASCDASNVGSVAGAGSSIAHDLHDAGIAMVVAGQFPLSFEGSVRLVEVLYEGLLWGTDPRQLIFDVRRRLYSQFTGTHDWASLTTYLSLPRNFEKQLSAIKIRQALESVNAAMSHADAAILRTISVKSGVPQAAGNPGSIQTEPSAAQPDNVDFVLQQARQRMDDSRTRLNDLVAVIPEERATIYGLLASTEKRQAQVLYHLRYDDDKDTQTQENESERLLKDSKRLLVNARDHYWGSFQHDRSLHWAVVQYLSLGLIIARTPGLMDAEAKTRSRYQQKDPRELWSMARLLSLYDLNHEKRDTRSWAHANLIELYMLSLLPEFRGLITRKEAERQAIEHTNHLLDIAGWKSFEAYSTRRQMLRYLDWYDDLTSPKLKPLLGLATEIFKSFPSEVEQAGITPVNQAWPENERVAEAGIAS